QVAGPPCVPRVPHDLVSALRQEAGRGEPKAVTGSGYEDTGHGLLLPRLDVLHDDDARRVRRQGLEDMRDVARVADVVARAELDRFAVRAGQDAAGAEDQVLDRAQRVRAG